MKDMSGQIVELTEDMSGSPLYSDDLAPVPAAGRTWSMWNISALWIGMAVNIPTYMLAAGLISAGMNWLQALFTITLGNLIVLAPMMMNGHAGTRYGVPFPVLLRASFGTVGANIPALMRALVACGWFGIQTWIGGSAIYLMLSIIFGFTPAGPDDMLPILGLSLGQFGSFMLFWAINIGVILAGIESIKWLETIAAPFLLLMGIALLIWAVNAAGGLAIILSDATMEQIRGSSGGDFKFWPLFWPSLTAMVGFWATLSLNIPDFTRYAKSQKDQMLGQLIGLPTTMLLFSFIGITVTGATVIIYGEAIWDPIALLSRFESKTVVALSLVALTVATLSTNIAANVVSPANDFSNLSPKNISFKMGGIITGVIGILIFPWKLLSDFNQYIFTWLIGYSALLGAITGVMLTDYFLLRKMRLSLADLYRTGGEYSYGSSGINWRAIWAIGVGIVVNIPGFLYQASAGTIHVPPFFIALYDYAWFIGLLVAGSLYYGLSLSRFAAVAGERPDTSPE
ncbi:MAG: NCS1 family nucleobase:cation symporter-1 [Candidatus Marinimicrobia bacterium]|nr:NCS1 family nucleobase:cation symporter-1 [Candidatus Neomarinimicrobiota bacterium]